MHGRKVAPNGAGGGSWNQLTVIGVSAQVVDVRALKRIRYTKQLAEAGIEPSVGSVGDSFETRWPESIIGLFKTEVTRRDGPWRHLDHVEFATLEWVHWFNTTAARAHRRHPTRRARSDPLPSAHHLSRSGWSHVTQALILGERAHADHGGDHRHAGA